MSISPFGLEAIDSIRPVQSCRAVAWYLIWVAVKSNIDVWHFVQELGIYRGILEMYTLNLLNRVCSDPQAQSLPMPQSAESASVDGAGEACVSAEIMRVKWFLPD